MSRFIKNNNDKIAFDISLLNIHIFKNILIVFFLISINKTINGQCSIQLTGDVDCYTNYVQNLTLSSSGGTPMRNTYTGTNANGSNPMRVLWINNRWEVQQSVDGTWYTDHYSTFASAPNPPNLSVGNWQRDPVCSQLTQFDGSGTQSTLTAYYISDANFAAAVRNACPTCINDCNLLTSAAASLTSLDVSSQNISDLTGIAGFTSLQTLYCNGNQLTSLPTLPSSLQTFHCWDNQLTSLPTLPSGLQILSCEYNQLTSLPTLPSSLQTLYCNNNQLTNLPTLPSSLQLLLCFNTPMTCLPTLPSSLQTLLLSPSTIKCLPNKPSSLVVYNGLQTVNLPVCALSIDTHPSVSGSPIVGQTTTFTAQATGSGTMTVKWQRKGASESSFTDISGTSATYTSTTNTTYTTPNLTVADQGASYRAVFTANCVIPVETNAATLSTILPVELLSFNGEYTNEGNLLTWQTAEEKDARGFDIERSHDGQFFTKIGTESAKGSNSNYVYLDLKNQRNLNYYRLKLVDLDGSFSYSKIIAIETERGQRTIKIYPTTTEGGVTIENGTLNNSQISVFNAMGQQVSFYSSVNWIDLSNLPSGMYLIQVQTGSTRVIEKVFRK